jgi:putative transposase
MCGEWDVSIRHACRVLEVDTSTYHYKSRRHDQAGIEARIKDVCTTRVRYGYRRVHVMLRREGWNVNAKKVYRIYNELGLQLRTKTSKRRVKAKLRDDRQPATQPNQTWAMDFVHDQLATGRKIRVLTVIDTFSRFSPIVDPRFSYRAEDVVAALEQTCGAVGYPKTIRVDQGSEFISRDLDLWAYANGVTLDFSRPGKPTDNAFIEAFNGRLRAECLNAHWFLTLADAQEKLEAWRSYYNEVRPHGAIGNRSPISLQNPDGAPARHRENRPETLPSAGPKMGCRATGPKLYLRPVQRWGAEQSRSDSRYGWMRNGGHVNGLSRGHSGSARARPSYHPPPRATTLELPIAVRRRRSNQINQRQLRPSNDAYAEARPSLRDFVGMTR